MISRVKSLDAESTWCLTDSDQSGRMSWYTSSLDPCKAHARNAVPVIDLEDMIDRRRATETMHSWVAGLCSPSTVCWGCSKFIADT